MPAIEEGLHALFARSEGSQSSDQIPLELRLYEGDQVDDVPTFRYYLRREEPTCRPELSWLYLMTLHSIETHRSVFSEDASVGGSWARSQSISSEQISLG